MEPVQIPVGKALSECQNETFTQVFQIKLKNETNKLN